MSASGTRYKGQISDKTRWRRTFQEGGHVQGAWGSVGSIFFARSFVGLKAHSTPRLRAATIRKQRQICAQHIDNNLHVGTIKRTHCCFFKSSLLSSSSHRRLYPQRPSGQAVVIGLFPSPPRYFVSFLSRIVEQYSHFSASSCMSIFINFCTTVNSTRVDEERNCRILLAIKVKARTVVGRGEEGPLCDAGSELILGGREGGRE